MIAEYCFSFKISNHFLSTVFLTISYCFKLILWVSFIPNSKVIQIRFIFILCGQTGICQIAFFRFSTLSAHDNKTFQVILNDKRNDIVFDAFLEHNQSAHTTVTILELMNSLKFHMEVQDILKSLFFFSIILYQQHFHFIGNLFRKCGFHTANFIW